MNRSHVVPAVVFALGIALLVYLTARIGVHEVAAMLAQLRWTIAPVLILSAVQQYMRAAALRCCVTRPQGLRLADALRIRLSGEAVEFLAIGGPVLAEPTKAWLLQQHGLRVREGFVATLAEYLVNSFVAAMMAVVALGYVLAVRRPTGAVHVASLVVFWGMSGFVALLVLGFAARLHIIGAAIGGVARLWPGAAARLRAGFATLDDAEDSLIETVRGKPRRLMEILLFECVGQLMLILELWCLVRALQLPIGIGQAALVEGAIKFIASGYFFVPAQVGVAEGSYAVVFVVFGYSAAAGLTVSLARRVRGLVIAAVGLLPLVLLSRSRSDVG
jgi:hypothetical protein